MANWEFKLPDIGEGVTEGETQRGGEDRSGEGGDRVRRGRARARRLEVQLAAWPGLLEQQQPLRRPALGP